MARLDLLSYARVWSAPYISSSAHLKHLLLARGGALKYHCPEYHGLSLSQLCYAPGPIDQCHHQSFVLWQTEAESLLTVCCKPFILMNVVPVFSSGLQIPSSVHSQNGSTPISQQDNNAALLGARRDNSTRVIAKIRIAGLENAVVSLAFQIQDDRWC